MINLMLGVPGSGKSYELVVYQILPALRAGRMVITNLPLNVEAFASVDPEFPALIQLRSTAQLVRGDFDADPASRGRADMFNVAGDPGDWRPHSGRCYSNVWDYYTTWKHPESGIGPLFVIDEAHLSLPKIGTSREVSEWFSKHRHFNVDVVLATQSHNKMDVDIRDSVQSVVRVRKALALGKDGVYFRRVLDGVRGATIEETERRYKPQFFKLYRSHTQGNSVSEVMLDDVTPFYVKFRRATWAVLALALVGLLVTIPALVSDWRSNTVRPQVAKAITTPSKPSAAMSPAVPGQLPAWAIDAGAIALPVRAVASAPVAAPVVLPDLTPEPFQHKGLHLVGRVVGRRADGSRLDMYMIALSMNGAVVSTVSSVDVASMGYKWTAFTDCAGVLDWRGKQRAVTCDQAQIGISVGGSPSSATQASRTVDPPPPATEHDGHVIGAMRNRERRL